MHETTIRKASPSDAQVASKLIYLTGSYFFDYIFFNDRKRILSLLQYLFQKRWGIFSYKFCTVAESDNLIEGIELGYGRLQKMFNATFSTTFIIKNFSPIHYSTLFYRDFIVHHFFKSIVNGSYYIAHLATESDSRNYGVATRLLKNAFTKAKNKGYKTCSLDVSIENHIAINLYKKFGFRVIKEIRHVYLEKNRNLEGQYRMLKQLY